MGLFQAKVSNILKLTNFVDLGMNIENGYWQKSEKLYDQKYAIVVKYRVNIQELIACQKCNT